MGMSASQARLLSLTSRLSDLEYKAQAISNDKIRLADKNTEASQKYEEALDKQKLTVIPSNTSSKSTQVDATASNLTTYENQANTKQKMLKSASGKILVPDNIAKAYEASGGNLGAFLTNAFGAANAVTYLTQQMKSSDSYNNLTGANSQEAASYLQQIGTAIDSAPTRYSGGQLNMDADWFSSYLQTVTQWVGDNNVNTSPESVASDQNLLHLITTGVADDSSDNALNVDGESFGILSYLNIPTILSELQQPENKGSSPEYDEAQTAYYTNVFDEIQANGYDTINSDNMNDSEWLYNQLNAGNIFISEYNDKGGSDGTGAWGNISFSSGDAALQVEDDTSDQTKAKAVYDSTMAEIEAKDNRFDLQLKTIDTEHTAIQTEVDSVKKVIDKNIERSFKIFDA